MAHEYTSWAWSQGIRGSGRKSVLVALADRANGDGYSYPGQKTLAEMTGQSERSVREHVEWLEENGYVRRKERRRSDGTRTSDGYNLPPMDSTGNIRRWTTTGNTRRLTQEHETPDQNEATTPPATGKSRHQSTGRIRQTNRQNSPSSPAESAGHELPGELPDTEPLKDMSAETADAKPTFEDLVEIWNTQSGRLRKVTDLTAAKNNPALQRLANAFLRRHGHRALELFAAGIPAVRNNTHWLGSKATKPTRHGAAYGITNYLRNAEEKAEEAADLTTTRPRASPSRELPTADDFKHVPTAAELLGITGGDPK